MIVKNVLSFLARWIILGALLYLALGKSEASMTHLVFMDAYTNSFSPYKLVVQKGDRVKWINRDFRMHNVVFESLKTRSPMLRNGYSWSHTFEKTGVYDYYCAPHRTMGMVGIVEVVE